MLVELRVENYAVIDQLAVEFAPGLNLVTGENSGTISGTIVVRGQ